MPTLNLYPIRNKADEQGTAPLLLVWQDRGQRVSFSPRERVYLKQWDEGKQRVRKGHPNASDLNAYLERLITRVQTLERQLKAGDKLSPQALKAALDEEYSPKATAPRNALQTALTAFIGQAQGQRSANTVKTYRTLERSLLGFAKARRYSLDFDRLDSNFYAGFTTYLAEQGNTQSTVGKKLALLKLFLRWAEHEHGYTVNAAYQRVKASRGKTSGKKIALTWEELIHLFEFDLSARPALANVRDVFCFGAFTGLRFSDIEQLKPEHVRVDRLDLVIHKTREALTVPLTPQAKAILKRHEGRHLPYSLPVISNQKTNAALKTIGQLVGFDSAKAVTSFIGTRREEQTYAKWELLTTHTARRTYATLFLERGGRPEVLQKVLGHADIRQTMQYVKLTSQVIQHEVERVWNY